MPLRILITGATGFVGGYLAAECQRRYPGATLIGLGHQIAPVGGTQQREQGSGPAPVGISTVEADITDARQVRQVVAEIRPDLIFHLAGQASVAASWSDPARTLAVNAGGAVHLFEALRAEKLAPRVVLAGSSEQYGGVSSAENPIAEDALFRPANPYAVSKAAQDLYGYQYAMACQLPILRARSFNSFGPRQGTSFVVANFARQIALIETGTVEPVLRVGNLTPQRDFLPVQDTVRAYWAIAERGRAGEAYNIGSGQGREIEAVLHALVRLARVDITIRQDTARFRPVDVPVLVADTTKLRRETGWEPTCDFAATLEATLDYWRHVVQSEPALAEQTEG
jgi:GDP-4-dehydro-6-deoxy-D-mannose reductase